MSNSDLVYQQNTMSANWMNNKFLETVLGSEVETFEVKPLGDSNDFFTSSLHRVTVNLKSGRSEHLIVKKLIDREGDGRLFAESSMFSRETYMYSVVLPKLQEMLNKAFPGCEPIAAKYVCSSTGVLVLEDLSASGFKVLDRMAGVDLHNSLLVMRCLARFHAASVILYEQEPELFEPFMDTVFNEEPIQKLQGPFFKGMSTLLAEEVENWPGFGERYAKKFREMSGEMIKLVVEGARRHEERFNVLTHDDIWTSNLMFRPPDSIRLIDFQMPHYASPGNDLQMFLTMSVADDVRHNHFDTLMKEYHTTLCDTLTALSYQHKLLTLEELYEEYKKSALYGFVINAIFLPGVLACPDADIRMFVTDGAAPSHSIFEGSRARTTMAEILKEYEKQGAFSLT
ncbi:hypothetical protein L9F63_002940 [Diploptera punctata]|uniref:CHK kinase-like domain-containing protein n=1 Tax=Diploptera punctata TaxID=6984 RepID=A0AAD7ZRG8_DIPPU|nr:hypothetical protein L9F63_002940 [Diploptera punctata]